MKTIDDIIGQYEEHGKNGPGMYTYSDIRKMLREAMEIVVDKCAGVAYHELHDGASRTIACNQIRGLKEQIQ